MGVVALAAAAFTSGYFLFTAEFTAAAVTGAAATNATMTKERLPNPYLLVPDEAGGVVDGVVVLLPNVASSHRRTFR